VRKPIVAAGLSTLVLAGAAAIYAAGTVSEQQSLRGVKPIRIASNKLRSDVAADGLDAAKLRATMDARLKAQALPVSNNATNDLFLIVSTSPPRDGYYAVHLHLELRQLVALFHEYIRDPETQGMAATWNASWVGVLKKDELNKVDDELAKLVDLFIADWRVGNLGRNR
jgi:hypothetical protein